MRGEQNERLGGGGLLPAPSMPSLVPQKISKFQIYHSIKIKNLFLSPI